jgi:hypothetical protein
MRASRRSAVGGGEGRGRLQQLIRAALGTTRELILEWGTERRWALSVRRVVEARRYWVKLAADGSTRYWQTEFYRFIEAIAEEKTKVYDPRSPEEYNIKKLMLRPFERKPLSYYTMSRVRDAVVLILDNSGSMEWWASNLRILADLALSREDVEVYVAPNGFIKARITSRGVEPADHEEVMRRLRGRRVVYVGDFDGANTPVELSWYNDVIWICPESRYRRFRAHDWVRYDEGDFRDAFLRVYTLSDYLHTVHLASKEFREFEALIPTEEEVEELLHGGEE